MGIIGSKLPCAMKTGVEASTESPCSASCSGSQVDSAISPASLLPARNSVLIAIAPPCENPARTMRPGSMPRCSSRAMSDSSNALLSPMPAASTGPFRSSEMMSYQARIAMPPFRVTGRTGAWGKTKRSGRVCGRRSSGTMGSKSWPSAPSPCSQMTLAVGAAPVSTSTVWESDMYAPGVREGNARVSMARSVAGNRHRVLDGVCA